MKGRDKAENSQMLKTSAEQSGRMHIHFKTSSVHCNFFYLHAHHGLMHTALCTYQYDVLTTTSHSLLDSEKGQGKEWERLESLLLHQTWNGCLFYSNNLSIKLDLNCHKIKILWPWITILWYSTKYCYFSNFTKLILQNNVHVKLLNYSVFPDECDFLKCIFLNNCFYL